MKLYLGSPRGAFWADSKVRSSSPKHDKGGRGRLSGEESLIHLQGLLMYLIDRNSSWENIRHKGVTSLSGEGKIMLKISKSFFTDSESSEFLRFCADLITQSGVPSFGKRSTGLLDHLKSETSYHQTFLFYSKNRFDALYVYSALGAALNLHSRVHREIMGETKVGRARAVTDNRRWKSNFESRDPIAGREAETPSGKKVMKPIMEYLVKKNPNISDLEIAALLAFNDYCPVAICDRLDDGFVGIEDGRDVVSPVLFERFRSLGGRDMPFFHDPQNIGFEAVLKNLSMERFSVPDGMRQPSDGGWAIRSYS